jgi:hypothetical protein
MTHKITHLDFCYDGDFIASAREIEQMHDVKLKLESTAGPGGGWPGVSFYGTKENLIKLLKESYGDDDGDFIEDIEEV